uniref:Uncharacterized protein n=1 Tax=Peromyscus maniculatus bairdii TaxID=230844 RepID=A0A8C8UEN6_PERMB
MPTHDDCLMIACQMKDVFISCSQEETQEMLEAAKKICKKKLMELSFLETDLEQTAQEQFGKNAPGGAPGHRCDAIPPVS